MQDSVLLFVSVVFWFCLFLSTGGLEPILNKHKLRVKNVYLGGHVEWGPKLHFYYFVLKIHNCKTKTTLKSCSVPCGNMNVLRALVTLYSDLSPIFL